MAKLDLVQVQEISKTAGEYTELADQVTLVVAGIPMSVK